MNNNTNQTESQSNWKPTRVPNLIRYKPSGIYFARVRVRHKLFRASLKTDDLDTAKLLLNDFINEKREEMGDVAAIQSGKMTVADAIAIFRKRLDAKQDIKEGAKIYRRKCIEALLKSWPELASMSVREVSEDDCRSWSKRYADRYSPSVYNNTVGTLRMIMAIAIEKRVRSRNPALIITKKRVQQKELNLPSPEQFEKFLEEMENAGGRFSKDCADLVRFLAFGGFRITEAANIHWGDCDLDNGQIRLRVTKNGKARSVPMIPDMKALLLRLKSECLEATASDPVMFVNECRLSMTRAAKKVGMSRITHHDLRHLFATKCIESGVDIPTVSRWLGHSDGGALAMKVYGHLRDHHSVSMAAKVSFAVAPVAA